MRIWTQHRQHELFVCKSRCLLRNRNYLKKHNKIIWYKMLQLNVKLILELTRWVWSFENGRPKGDEYSTAVLKNYHKRIFARRSQLSAQSGTRSASHTFDGDTIRRWDFNKYVNFDVQHRADIHR